MKHSLLGFLILLTLSSCTNDNSTVDVSNVKIDFNFYDFQKQLFEIDTANFDFALNSIYDIDSTSFNHFFKQVLGLSKLPSKEAYFEEIKIYFRSYKPVYDSLKKMPIDKQKIEEELYSAFQYMKYYFPKYRLPKVVLCITTLDAFITAPFGVSSEILTDSCIFISLLFHAGKDFSYYQYGQFMYQYPEYIRDIFIPDNITPAVIKLLLDDMYPEYNNGENLLNQMITKGKKLSLLEKILPSFPKHILLNYTKEKMLLCDNTRGLLWKHFRQSDLLFSKDPNIIRRYIGISPFTISISKDLPGNIGSYVGWQIVKAYEERHPPKHIADIMKVPSDDILQKSKYKPK